MTREEFEEMFNHRYYESMRKKYHAEHVFPDVFEKVTPESWLLNLKEHERHSVCLYTDDKARTVTTGL